MCRVRQIERNWVECAICFSVLGEDREEGRERGMDGGRVGWMDRQMDRCKNRWIDRGMDGRTEGRKREVGKGRERTGREERK